MWWLEVLFFSFGIGVPIVLTRWLEERYYEHHNVPGKTAMERINYLLDLLRRDVVRSEDSRGIGGLLSGHPFGNDRGPDPSNAVFMSLKDQPISLNVKILSVLAVLVSWLSVLFGLHFFEGIGSFFDHWVWSIPVYFVFITTSFLFLYGILISAMDEPKGDLKEFPNILLYTHSGGVGILFLLFSAAGLLGNNLLQWSEELANDFAALLILMALSFFFLGGFSAWNTFQEEKRATKISHRLSMLDMSDRRRSSNLDALKNRLKQDLVAPKFITTLEKAIEKNYSNRRNSIHIGLDNQEIPSMKAVKETTSTKIPTYKEVLMNYWVPLGKPNRDSDFTAWEAYLLEEVVAEGTGGPKAHRKRLKTLQKHIVDPIKNEFELQYTLAKTVDQVRILVNLYERFADFPEVIERVTAGEAEEFVLIDLNMMQD